MYYAFGYGMQYETLDIPVQIIEKGHKLKFTNIII